MVSWRRSIAKTLDVTVKRIAKEMYTDSVGRYDDIIKEFLTIKFHKILDKKMIKEIHTNSMEMYNGMKQLKIPNNELPTEWHRMWQLKRNNKSNIHWFNGKLISYHKEWLMVTNSKIPSEEYWMCQIRKWRWTFTLL